MTEKEAKSVVLEARARHVRLPRELLDLTDAGRPNAGTAHGVLHLQGFLTRDQWAAAEWWIGARLAYLRSIGARSEVRVHSAGEGDGDDAAYADWCRAVRATWDRARATILRASIEQRSPIASALDVILVRGHALEHLVGDLRVGLNAIHREFLAGRKAA